MILGVSGLNGAGKGEVVRFLEARSFYALSLSDVIREELRAKGLEETRERMIEAGRALRTAHGPGALAERLAPRLLPDRNYVIDSVRHPAEVEALRARTGRFKLIWVDANEGARLARIRARGRSGDPTTLAELRAFEARELGSDDAAGQQLLAVQQLADVTLRNDGDLPALHDAIQRTLERSFFFERPSWDEYFMAIARVVASRSNCVKRKVAAVITLDRRLISTGYNGTPRGVRNCNEGGCPRCNSFAEGGSRLDECLCSHGEENAITQAAYHGVSVRGGTLYTTFCPCLICTKMIINSGIAEVVYNADYPMGDVSLGLLREAGVKVRQVALGADSAAPR
jgi:dCMP deaminase